MRIYLQKPGGRPWCIALPNSLFCNRLSACILAGQCKRSAKEDMDAGDREKGDSFTLFRPKISPTVTARQWNDFFKSLKRIKKQMRGKEWYLLDVEGADGSRLRFRL